MVAHICNLSTQKAETGVLSNFKDSMGYKVGPCLSNLPHNNELKDINLYLFRNYNADTCFWVMDSDWNFRSVKELLETQFTLSNLFP